MNEELRREQQEGKASIFTTCACMRGHQKQASKITFRRPGFFLSFQTPLCAGVGACTLTASRRPSPFICTGIVCCGSNCYFLKMILKGVGLEARGVTPHQSCLTPHWQADYPETATCLINSITRHVFYLPVVSPAETQIDHRILRNF